jgi:hypothetical protein
MSGPTSDEVTEEWRILHNEKFHNLCSSPYIIRMISSRVMRQPGHVAWMSEMQNAYDTLI